MMRLHAHQVEEGEADCSVAEGALCTQRFDQSLFRVSCNRKKSLVEYAVLPQKVEYEVSQRQRFGILAVSFQLHCNPPR